MSTGSGAPVPRVPKGWRGISATNRHVTIRGHVTRQLSPELWNPYPPPGTQVLAEMSTGRHVCGELPTVSAWHRYVIRARPTHHRDLGVVYVVEAYECDRLPLTPRVVHGMLVTELGLSAAAARAR